jgi:signal transduction histidine kinase/ligand-binding sensor domain-containing protein
MPPQLLAAFLLFFFAIGLTNLKADETASDWFYRAWLTEDGLPDNSVSGIAQAPDGYLWIGTNGGIIRFNGTEFTPLPLHQIPGLPSRQVRAMFLDGLGRIWLSMERGPVIRIAENSFHAFTFEEGIFPEKVPTSMVDDPEGRLWIAYPSGLCLVEGDKVTRIDTSEWFPNRGIAGLTCDTSGQVWLSNDGKLGRIGVEGFELVRDFEGASINITASVDEGIWLTVNHKLMRLDPNDQLHEITDLPTSSEVITVFQDRDQAIWIGTHGDGLLRFNNGSLKRVPTSYGWIDCITQDRDGNIWTGTIGGGLNLIRPRIVTLIGKTDGLPFTAARSTTCDTSGKIWAVSQTGRLASKESNEWIYHNDAEDSEWVNCVSADQKGRIWVGTRYKGLQRLENGELKQYEPSNGIISPFVRSILTAANGDVWIATDRPHELFRLRDENITPIKHEGSLKVIRAMAEGADGTIWIGTSDGRLLRVDGDELIDEKAAEKIPSIRTLHSTPDGSLWIGYPGEGLGHLKDGQYNRITLENGLYDDYISQIQDDGNGSLWIAANRGLFQMNIDELLALPSSKRNKVRCRVFGRNDGLPSFQPSRDYSPGACRDLEGRLYFSTSNGLVEVQPGIMSADALPPPIVLEKVTVDGEVKALYQARAMIAPDHLPEQIDLSQPNPKIVVPPGHDRLVINFAALSLASPENLGFRYQLKPLVKSWENPDNDHSTTFTKLPAGSYKFQIIACNSAGVWNNLGATLDIVVLPFFWETWWFKVAGGLLTAFSAGGIVYLGLRRKHRHQIQRLAAKRALELERGRIARDIHDDLGASLTRISLLSQSSPNPEDETTTRVLGQIQTTARHLMRSMDEVVWAIDPEHDSFDDLANYLSSHAQEFLSVAGLSCRLNLPVDLPELPLTAQIRHNLFLAFKEALNNVVKYAEATEVRISMQSIDNFLILTVQDNGSGIDPNAPADPIRSNSGSGLQNMESRMKEIGGSCTLQSTLGEGTTVEFKVPIKTNP